MKFLQQNVISLQGKLLESNSIRIKPNDTSKTYVVVDKRRFGTSWPLIVGACTLSVVLVTSLFVLQTRFEVKTEPGKSSKEAAVSRVLSCYYIPSKSNRGPPVPDPPVHLCTHINVGFARVAVRQLQLAPELRAALPALVALKRDNPALKILLSVGGAGDTDGFPEMVVNHTSRKVFIRSIKSILRQYRLDGIDLDWEFPAMHYSESRLGTRERQHFSQLLREIRMEYEREKRSYLLTVAVAAPQVIVDVSYDVDQIALYADYANVMTYDFHYYTKYTPFTGLNSPLYARPTEELYLATLNVNYTVAMYRQKGLPRDKIVIGIPTYGHTFTLVNPENNNVGSPASGFGRVGALGFADYGEVCAFVAANASRVTIVFEEHARAPYLFTADADAAEWISFESQRSAAEKAAFAASAGLRGAMLYSLDADDATGRCGAGPYPLATAVRTALGLP